MDRKFAKLHLSITIVFNRYNKETKQTVNQQKAHKEHRNSDTPPKQHDTTQGWWTKEVLEGLPIAKTEPVARYLVAEIGRGHSYKGPTTGWQTNGWSAMISERVRGGGSGEHARHEGYKAPDNNRWACEVHIWIDFWGTFCLLTRNASSPSNTSSTIVGISPFAPITSTNSTSLNLNIPFIHVIFLFPLVLLKIITSIC